MNKEKVIRFAGLMEEYLNIPAFVCEMIQQQLEENKYKEVVEYVVQRRNEIESKPDFISDRNAITMLVNQNEQKDKEISRLNNIITKLENKIHLLEKHIHKLNLEVQKYFDLLVEESSKVSKLIEYDKELKNQE